MHKFVGVNLINQVMSLASFYTPWKHRKTSFLYVFKGYRKRPVARNCLNARELQFMLTWGKIETYYYYSFKLNSVLEKEKGVSHLAFKPFFPNVPFLHSLKTSENLMIFWCFQGVEKGCIGNKWTNNRITIVL